MEPPGVLSSEAAEMLFSYLEEKNVRNNTDLHRLGYGHCPHSSDQRLRLLKQLINDGADVNAQDINGLTPLCYFLTNETNFDADCIEGLLNENANVNLANDEGEIALHVCLDRMADYSSERLAVFKMILDKTADINAPNADGRSPLWYALNHPDDHPEYFRAILEAGADVNWLDSTGGNILHRLINFYEVSIHTLALVVTLIEAGADANTMNKDGLTPVMQSIANHCDPILILTLLKNGANLFCPADELNKGLPLHYFLYNHGQVDGDRYDDDNKPIGTFYYDMQFSEHSNPILELLFDCGCEVNPEVRKHVFNGLSKAFRFFRYENNILFLEILLMNGAYMDSGCEQKLRICHLETIDFYNRHRSETIISDGAPVHALVRKYKLLYSEGLPENDATASGETAEDASPEDELLLRQMNSGILDYEPELNKLKAERVKEDLSLFELCTENDRRKLGSYFGGCNVDLRKWKKEFPNYCRLIEYKLEVAEKWHGILEKVRALPCWRSTTSGGGKVELPSTCVDRIMEFLTNLELMVLSTGDDLTVYYQMRCMNQLQGKS